MSPTRTIGNHRRYAAPRSGQLTVGYARVSCHVQKADLPRQIQPLRQHAGADMVLVKDIGSGLNCRKPGLKKLLALLVSGSVRELVLTHKDRLLRFGSELVFQLCSLLGIKVTVLDDAASKSPEAAFADDVLAIITVFPAKLYGARAHRPKPPPYIAQLCPSLPATAGSPTTQRLLASTVCPTPPPPPLVTPEFSFHASPSSDHRWFNDHVLPHEPMLRAWLRSRFPCGVEPDDLVQEAFARVLRAHASGAAMRSPKAFLFATARNLALDVLRHRQVSGEDTLVPFESLDVLDEGDGIPETVDRHEKLERLTIAIQSLPERCREVMTLRKVYGLSQKDIAKRLGISECTVSAQLTIGVRKCTESFARDRREAGLR